MVDVFGKRETELAAIKVLDAGWSAPMDPITLPKLDADEQRGIELLISGAWITRLPGGQVLASIQFWQRVHGR